MQPPDIAVVPPSTAAFSSTNTRAPATLAANAALNPAAPVPTTITSVCVCSLTSASRHHCGPAAMSCQCSGRALSGQSICVGFPDRQVLRLLHGIDCCLALVKQSAKRKGRKPASDDDRIRLI
jgi:hypothetical protein